MRENRHFIRSSDVSTFVPATIDGKPAFEAYGELIEVIEERAGRETASLFAEPVLPRTGQTATISAAPISTVSWYTVHEGPIVELDRLDEVERRPVAQKLASRIAALQPLLADARLGAAIATWLNVASSKSILSIGGEPVLLDWALLPQDAAASESARRAHFARTLGERAPGVPLPPLSADGGALAAEASAFAEHVPSAPSLAQRGFASVGAAAAPIEPGRGGSGALPPSSGNGDDGSGDARGWRTPLIATAIAALVLLILLLPGVLVYPAGDAAQSAFEEERLKASNRSLEVQLETLKTAAQGDQCRPGQMNVPVTPSADPAAPELHDSRMDLVPPAPQQLRVPQATGQPVAESVGDLLDKATVLVVGIVPPDHSSQGSGFFISDRHIVTNHHVIAKADPQLIFVASQSIGGIRRARLIAKSEPPPTESDVRVDLAVLEIEAAPGRALLKIGTTPPKLSTAYVAGFPAFLTERDINFQNFLQKLVAGLQERDVDATLARQQFALPGADLKYGRINNVMHSGSSALPIILHDMQLAQGNSGGPLVDGCGRLGGVNTSLFQNSQGPQQGNVAQDASLLRAFLKQNNIAFEADDSRCEPAVASAAPAPAPETAPGGNPGSAAPPAGKR